MKKLRLSGNGACERPVQHQGSIRPFLSSKTPSELASQTNNGVGNTAVTQTRSGKRVRSCPFYKIVPGTGFTVDAFSYGDIPGCTAYFLSHFHADHYLGLTRQFQHMIYCSKVTANLVKKELKVHSQFVSVLNVNTSYTIDGVEVILLDANHCPGSVMFLFKLSGKGYLFTGDFRYHDAMLLCPQLRCANIDQLFLDTTYCSPEHDFPKQEEVIAFAIDKVLTAMHNDLRTLVVCGTYTIGKEKVFLAIAEILGQRVYVNNAKKAILECLEDKRIATALTTDPFATNLHVVQIGKLSVEHLTSYLEQHQSRFTSLLAFKPTGWTHSSKSTGLASLKPHCKGPVTIYGIPYSEHSSFSELRSFVQFLKPCRIIPTVNNYSSKKRDEMQRIFHSWLTKTNQAQSKVKQTTLDELLK